MARKIAKLPHALAHRWYLAEWAERLGKRQADAVRDLGWPRSNVSDLWNGKQRYNQEHVDEVSAWLGILPHELLMPPKEADFLRRLRAAAQEMLDEARGLGEDAEPQDRAKSVRTKRT